MAKIKTAYLVVDVPVDTDAMILKVRETNDHDAPAISITVPSPRPASLRIPVSDIPFLEGDTGTVTAYLSWADAVGNESDLVMVAGPLDLKVPPAPTGGRFEQS